MAGRSVGQTSMLWLKPIYEVVGLPKLYGMAIYGDLCDPPRLHFIRAADIDPLLNVAVPPDDVGPVFFHQSHPQPPLRRTLTSLWAARAID